MPRKDPNRHGTERGPKLNESVCIGEEVKIGVHLAVERFRLDPSQEELVFPSSLSTNERAYIHRFCTQLGSLKTWSRGNGQNRYISVRKIEGGKFGKTNTSLFSLAHSGAQVNTLLSKYPVTAKEKLDLTPRAVKSANAIESKDKSNFGRLTNSVPQIPTKRGASELSKFRESLPVYQMGKTIVDGVNDNKVVLIAGETGSGKTTQVPQLLLDDCFERKQACRMLCTQPRRIAAVSIAERVAAERGERVGHTVGYQIRLENKVSPKTVLTFCTTGVLLRTLMGGSSCLDKVTHVIVDEVHERDRFTDFLLLCLKEALPQQPNLHVILMSATLNMDLFSGYFDNCPVVCVPGSLFPVDEYFLEDILKWVGYKNKAMDKALSRTKTSKVLEEKLTEWCAKQLNINDSAADSGTEADSDVTTSDNAELGEEKEDLEPWVVEEMDRFLREVWLTGNEELFHQVLYLISSENVSVDYVQSETGTTPLMIAAGRGFINVVEHLLTLGADANFKTSNNWTALDFAKKFNRTNIVDLLEAHLHSLDSTQEGKEEEDLQLISEEDRQLLSVYQQSFDDEKVDISLVACLLHKIYSAEREGAILVFLPGYDDIISLKTAITEDRRFQQSKYVIYLLHSALQYSDQKRVFKPPPQGVRKIILSTNIAETSITINDVVFVVDCGKVKEKTFDALTSLTMLKSNWISKASALQRKGRAGRCQPGKCYHLFSRPRYMHLQDYQTPEILRLPLQELCLHTKLLAPSNQPIDEFLGKCPQAPPQLVIRTAVQVLKQIDALDNFEDLTDLGHHLADLPIEPRFGKMVLYAVVLKCLDPVLTVVCALSYKEPFIIPALPSEKRSVMMKRRKFAEETYSDHMVFLRAFQAWQKARAEGWERAFCDKNYISSSTMEMLLGMRMQILTQLRASGFLRARGAGDVRDLNTNSDNWALVKGCLVAGTYPNIIQRDTKMCLCTTTEKSVRFHSSSVLQPIVSATSFTPAKSLKKVVKTFPSKWLIFEEMSRSQRVSLAKYCSVVSPASVFLFGGHSKLTADAVAKDSPPEPADDDPEDEDEKTEFEDPLMDDTGTVKVDDWIGFRFDCLENAKTAMQFRMKWHTLFLNRMRHPSKPWQQSEEAILQAVCAVLTNADKEIGLENPVGIGQRPRTVEPLMGGGFDEYYGRPGSGGGSSGGGGFQQQQQQQHHHQHHHQQHYQHHQQQQQQHMYRNTSGGGGGGGRGYSGHQQRNYQNFGRGRGGGESTMSTPSSESPKSASPTLSSTTATGHATSDVQFGEGCRYFAMRCNNQKIVDVSESKSIWATSASNEAKLNRAFNSGKPVYLIFFVPGNATFQGYARMTSAIGRERSSDFPGSGMSGVFSVEWIKRALLPFCMTNSLVNSWNENRRVHASRDGQEIEPKVAVELLKLWDTLQLRRPQSAGKGHKKSGGQQHQRTNPKQSSNPQQQKHQSQKKEKESGAKSRGTPDVTGEPQSDSGKDQGEAYQSSPSPALSTHTSTSSTSSSASSPSHKPQQAQSAATSASGKRQASATTSSPGMIPQTPAQIMAQQGYPTNSPTSASKSFYSGNYQQQQQGVFNPTTMSLAVAPGMNPLLMGQPVPMGSHPGLSPVMILQRGGPNSVQQGQSQYYSGGQFNQPHN